MRKGALQHYNLKIVLMTVLLLLYKAIIRYDLLESTNYRIVFSNSYT